MTRTYSAVPGGRITIALIAAWCASTLVVPSPAHGAEQDIQVARLTSEAAPVPVTFGQQLGQDDLTRYRTIFALQGERRFAAADREIAKVTDPLLLGHVLAERYLQPAAYQASYEELRRWLMANGDQPQAADMRRLAVRIAPAGAAPLPAPFASYPAGTLRQPAQDERAGSVAVPLGAKAGASGSWRGARIAYAQARYDDAIRQGFGSTDARGRWFAGLAAWRLGRFAEAAQAMADMASAPKQSPDDAAAASFWAARASMAAGRPGDVGRFLRNAARRGDTFYGVLARAVIGQPLDYDWDVGGLKDETIANLLRFPGSRRALALGEIGRVDLAESEIRLLAARGGSGVNQSLLALTERLKLPSIEISVAQNIQAATGRQARGALYPTPAWPSAGGFDLDPALMYAVARAESGFDHRAVSPAGARGLMQIMPETAQFIGRLDRSLKRQPNLFDPKTNLDYGERFITWVLDQDAVEGNLIFMCVAYNAGMQRVIDWKAELGAGDDPLLFIESIPFVESRGHVKKILLNLWMYSAKLGRDAPSLKALAENRWPVYQEPVEITAELQHARN